MAHGEPTAWWADVQHLRSDYERTDEARRRADEADLAAPAPTRRTVEIRGRTVPAPPVPRAAEFDSTVDFPRRRRSNITIERFGARPDRMALWALLMGVMLILVAVTTADASVVGH